METSNLKNMMVLKEVPSNIIEEAIIILKKNINIKEVEMQNYIESDKKQKDKKGIKQNNKKLKDYIVKEAEMIINNYITKLEDNKKKEQKDKKKELKYKKMKKYLCITTIIAIIEMVIILIK